MQGLGKPPFTLSVRGIEETPQAIEAVSITLSCLPAQEGKKLLLKAPHSSGTKKSEGIKMQLTWKASAERSVFIVSAKGEENQSTLSGAMWLLWEQWPKIA